MSWDHDHVEELLAGFALDGLDGDDRGLAERAIREHLPGCDRCRETLDHYRTIAGDLALAAPAVAAPDLLAARLSRAAASVPSRTTRRASWAIAAAAIVGFGLLSGWNVMLSDRLDDAEVQQRWMAEAVATLGSPDAGVLSLEGAVDGQFQLLWAPDAERMYLVASGMDSVEEGVYHVWLGNEDEWWSAGTFVPDEGVAMVPMDDDPGSFDEVAITHEETEDVPRPSATPLAHAEVAPEPTVAPSPPSAGG
ncbi:MAG TPA: zf-HC2 domain-containing protein [Actinomycetota bacterium]